MITITLPDGSIKQFETVPTGLDVASFVAVGGIIIGMWLGLKIVGG